MSGSRLELCALALVAGCPAPDRSASPEPESAPVDRVSIEPGAGPGAALDSIVSIAACGDATCGLTADGRVACWGCDQYGDERTGLPWVIEPSATPIQLPGETALVEIACLGDWWGRDQAGELYAFGAGVAPFTIRTHNDHGVPIIVVPPDPTVEPYDAVVAREPNWVTASAWDWHHDSLKPLRMGISGVEALRPPGCYIAADGRVTCVGSNDLGHERWGPFPKAWSARALWPGPALACWAPGLELRCEVYDRDAGLQSTPLASASVPIPAPASGLVWDHEVCATMEDGGVACIDVMAVAELRTAPATQLELDVRYPGPIARLEVGRSEVCAVQDNGRVKCWRPQGGRAWRDWQPELSDLLEPTLTYFRFDSAFMHLRSNLHDVVDIAAGGSHWCALTKAGEVWCWGANDVGQLGNGEFSKREEQPTPVVAAIDPPPPT